MKNSEHISNDLPGKYGDRVFSDSVMRERLPKNIYTAIKDTITEGTALDPALADVVANAMKDWAIEKGATHFCHWFQPMTGMTAAKHDSFISPTSDGRIIMEFSGNELIRSEPDASSFPSGGLRATFEARGYTAWDCTSPVFVKNDGTNISLFIPSVFCTYTGHALDKKTPLLRSMDALNRQAIRVLRALGDHTAKRVCPTLGAEQEYFLIDKSFIGKRFDLMLTGRTLFGAPPQKGQEMDDHYFGALHERVASFMNEVNKELWTLGVSAKTQHNEVCPGQYELAPVFTTLNVATDHNQITMETLQKVALRHDFVCILHEKPFAGVNGSGKHNNWSMITDHGENLLEPGNTPHQNMQFLVFLFAVIRAVDKHATLLRTSIATPGNDHRLGGNEAPPAIISIFLGEQLTEIFQQLATGNTGNSRKRENLELGVTTIPPLPKDCTDRNRTSPFAFTGNKFEFRMPGASQSTATPNYVLNTIVADSLAEIADCLEKAGDVNAAAQELLQEYAERHKRIIFNGDNYSDEWLSEANNRNLPNVDNTVDNLIDLTRKENLEVLSKHGVLNQGELAARQEIFLENYSMVVGLEGRTALRMARQQILPACVKYTAILAKAVVALKAADADHAVQKEMLTQVNDLVTDLSKGIAQLEDSLNESDGVKDCTDRAKAHRDKVMPAMKTVRKAADNLEQVVDATCWPLPTYTEMLFIR